MNTSLTTASFVIKKKKKKLNYDYTDKFETSIECKCMADVVKILFSSRK